MADSPVILVAEDSENDVVILRKALSEAFIEHQLFVVSDGDECIDACAERLLPGRQSPNR